MKNKKLYYMCFCAALVGSLQTVYGQTEDEVGQLAAVSEDSSQVIVRREMDKIPTVSYRGKLVDAATGAPVQGGIVQAAVTTVLVLFPTKRENLKSRFPFMLHSCWCVRLLMPLSGYICRER